MTLAEFRVYRAQERRRFIDEHLKPMKAERAELWRQYLGVRWRIGIERDTHRRKSLSEELYAENGIAWQWARLDAAICGMEQMSRNSRRE